MTCPLSVLPGTCELFLGGNGIFADVLEFRQSLGLLSLCQESGLETQVQVEPWLGLEEHHAHGSGNGLGSHSRACWTPRWAHPPECICPKTLLVVLFTGPVGPPCVSLWPVCAQTGQMHSMGWT